MANEDKLGNPKAIIPLGAPNGEQLIEEIGQVIENASSNDRMVIILRKTKEGWLKYIGTNPEEATLLLAETKSEAEQRRRDEEKHIAEIKQSYIKVVFDSLGDQVKKVIRGY